MIKYIAYVNDCIVLEHNNFKQLFKHVVADGIEHVREQGFSRVLKIYNQRTGERICSVFFNQRSYLCGTDVSEVRVHRYNYDNAPWSKAIRTFTF